MDEKQIIGSRIQEARKRRHLTQQHVADALGIKRVSVTNWESGKTRPDLDKFAPLASLFGVSLLWLQNMSDDQGAVASSDDVGVVYSKRRPSLAIIGSFDPDSPDRHFDPDWDDVKGAGVVDGRLTYDAKIQGGIPEVAATPGLGNGTIDDDRAARLDTGGIATGHPVLNEWVIPSNYVRNALDAAPSQIVIMPVIGNSMAPVLNSNDRVLVDISQNAWVGDAVYIIDDGDTVLRAKTIKKVTASSPPEYRIISEASPDETEILAADRFRIVGRVVGRFTRM